MFAVDAPSLVTTALRRSGRDTIGDDRLSPAIDVLCADLDVTAHLHLSGRRETRRLVLGLLERRGEPVRPSLADTGPVDTATDPPPKTRGDDSQLLVVAALPTTPTDRLTTELHRRFGATLPAATGWTDTPTANAGGFSPNDAMHPQAIDLHSPFFECAWHVPNYAEWLSEQPGSELLDATLAAIERPTSPVMVRSMLFGLNPVDAQTDGVTIASVAPTPKEVDGFVDLVAAYRRRFSHSVDRDAIGRYWTWRLQSWPSDES